MRPNKWYYNPDRKAVTAGVTKRCYFTNLEEGIAFANENNLLVEQWKQDRRDAKQLSEMSTVESLLKAYYLSLSFTTLAESTKLNYRKHYKAWMQRRIGGVVMGKAKLTSFTVPLCQRFYEERAKDNAQVANETIKAFRLLFNFGIRMGYITFNAWSHVKLHRVKRRKEMWQRSHVRAFLNTAFSKWEWRNVGVLFYCLYEWGQRPSDMFKLKWSSIDWQARSVIFTQSKRGVTVKLPISDGLFAILKQQYEDFGDLQDYVAPQMTRRAGKWVPYSIATYNNTCRRIMKAADVPDTLQIRDLRRTAITETVEGGADAVTLMQLSGHQSIHSLQPYIVHTLTGSKKAQSIRGFPTQLMEGSEDDADNLLNGQRYFRRRQQPVVAD